MRTTLHIVGKRHFPLSTNPNAHTHTHPRVHMLSRVVLPVASPNPVATHVSTRRLVATPQIAASVNHHQHHGNDCTSVTLFAVFVLHLAQAPLSPHYGPLNK